MSVHTIPRKQAYGVKLLQWVVESESECEYQELERRIRGQSA